MSEKSKEKGQSPYLQLLLGLLPFDVNITKAALKDLVTEAEETSWPSVMRRSANLGLVLSTIGIAGFLFLFVYLEGFSNTPLENLGTGYKVGGAIVILMWISKFLLGLLQNIETGNSPLITEEEGTLATSFAEFLIGVSFVGMVSIPLYEIWNLDLLVGILLALTAIGVGISGICLTIGGAYESTTILSSLWEDFKANKPEVEASANLPDEAGENHSKEENL